MSPCQMQMQMQTSQSRLSLACKARAFPVGVHPHLAAAMLQTLVLLLLLLLHRCTSLVALLSQIRRLLLLLQQLRAQLGLMVLQLLQSLTQWHSPASRWKWRSPWAGCHPPVQLSASGCLRWTPPWFTSQGSRLRGSGIRRTTTCSGRLLCYPPWDCMAQAATSACWTLLAAWSQALPLLWGVAA